MSIQATAGKLHWNYFLALERDLEVVSRYVEFCGANENVYSIELAHLLFAAASEVDVVAKLLCEHFEPNAPRGNIDHYRAVLMSANALSTLPTSNVFIPRFGMTLTPWDNWANQINPFWWRSYNNVKHERDQYFQEATLKNAINALAALLLFNFHYYSIKLAPNPAAVLAPRDATRLLEPESTLLRLPDNHYYAHLIINTG